MAVDLAGERVVVTSGAETIGGAAVRLFRNAPLGEHTVEDFGLSSPRTHRGVFLGLTHVLPRMSSGASIVNTGARSASWAPPGSVRFVASKHG